MEKRKNNRVNLMKRRKRNENIISDQHFNSINYQVPSRVFYIVLAFSGNFFSYKYTMALYLLRFIWFVFSFVRRFFSHFYSLQFICNYVVVVVAIFFFFLLHQNEHLYITNRQGTCSKDHIT